MYKKDVIDFNNQCNVKKILFGAATVIQSAFRKYLMKKHYQAIIKKDLHVPVKNSNGLLEFSLNCLNNYYLVDCLVVLNDCTYNCNSLILSLNSKFFKNEIKKHTESNSKMPIMQIDISFIEKEYWEIIYQYIYGKEIKIKTSELRGLLQACEKLEINYLYEHCVQLIEKLKLKSPESLSSSTQSSTSEDEECLNEVKKSNSVKLSEKIKQDQASKNFFESLKPLKFKAKNYYHKFFTNIINKYRESQLTVESMIDNLQKLIDYRKMNSKQLHDCRAILKNEIFKDCNNENLKGLYKKLDSNLKCFYWKAVNREKATFILNELNISIH
jgi:hypothetical protein